MEAAVKSEIRATPLRNKAGLTAGLNSYVKGKKRLLISCCVQYYDLQTHFDRKGGGIGRNGSPVDRDSRIREPVGWSDDCERLSKEWGGEESD